MALRFNRRSLLVGGGVSVVAGIAVVHSTGVLSGRDKRVELVTALAEHIIPKTDTVGAQGAGVPDYIFDVLREQFSEDERESFLDDIDLVNGLVPDASHAGFLELPQTQQLAILQRVDGQEKLESDAWGKGDAARLRQAWKQLKQMTIFGYYTAETAQEELAYEQIPGRYTGCVPFEEVGRSWLDAGV